MNEIFNAKRFGKLFKKTLLEKPIQMFGFTGLSLAMVFLIYMITKALIGFRPAQDFSFIWGLPLGGSLLASLVLGNFSSNANGVSYLTLPASNFEKWLIAILIACVLYPIIFLIFYRVIDSSFVTIFHNSLDPHSPFYKERYESVYIFDFNGFNALKVYSLFFFLTGFSLLGCLYFNKIPFIKIAISIAMLLLTVIGLNWLLTILFFSNVIEAAPFDHITISVGKGGDGSIVMPEWANTLFHYGITYFIPALLFVLTFTRLREKEF